MKNLYPLKPQESTHFPKSVDHSMMVQISCGSFENGKLERTNVGAAMIIRCGGCSGESSLTNIYINYDTQGINDSVLIGRDVKWETLV